MKDHSSQKNSDLTELFHSAKSPVPPDLQQKIMLCIEEPSRQVTAYKPVISLSAWLIIGILLSAASAYILFSSRSSEMSLLNGIELTWPDMHLPQLPSSETLIVSLLAFVLLGISLIIELIRHKRIHY
ncbi:MAG: hypothetical protein JXQ90_01595 [Cyclobacteriaceae bacterium]